MNPETEHSKEENQTDSIYFEPYAKFAATLRTWLMAYGIGVPFLFATQEKFAKVIL